MTHNFIVHSALVPSLNANMSFKLKTPFSKTFYKVTRISIPGKWRTVFTAGVGVEYCVIFSKLVSYKSCSKKYMIAYERSLLALELWVREN